MNPQIEPINPPLTAAALAELALCHPPPESFGPESAMPCLAFHLEDSDATPGPWLSTLPCPVIGIGTGALAPFCDMVLEDDKTLPEIARNIAAHPVTSMVMVQHLRASEQLSPAAALTMESFAYATVQMGAEFLAWRKSTPQAAPPAPEDTAPVLARTGGDRLHITLNRPQSRNPIGLEARDALVEALDLALIDPEITEILLDSTGDCFSTGGELAEFGLVSDPATAHWIRSLRLPARRLVQFPGRLAVHVQGAAIGAGVEIAAFAARLTATKDAWFQLPELKYGLIPGAGGTVSLPRRIGRQKTAYMALSMRRIPAQTALAWGLVDEITP